MTESNVDLTSRPRAALEASWDATTAYQSLQQPGNPAYAQCWPTARVVQHFFPETEILEGKVWTGAREETHYCNGLRVGEGWQHIDLSWQQFPAGSVVRSFSVLDRKDLGTSKRTEVLLKRVEAQLVLAFA